RLGDLTDLLFARLLRSRALLLLGVKTRRLLEQHARGRRLQDERERPVGVHRDDDRNDQRLFHLSLRRSVELLAELHDVDALLTERRTDRRRGIRLSGRDLQLDLPCDLLHVALPPWFKRPWAKRR